MSLTRLTRHDFNAMDKRYRAHFINSLSGYKSANLVGTIDTQGITNLSIVSSVVHLGADPALIAFVNRPPSVPRHTLDNIDRTGCYTLNHVGIDFFTEAHHTSARYPAEISEFEQAGLTPVYHGLAAPYVQESAIKIGVEFRQKMDIQLNGTVLLIGEIVEVVLDDRLINNDGKVDIVAAKSTAVSGLDEYHSALSLGRLAYAKPKLS